MLQPTVADNSHFTNLCLVINLKVVLRSKLPNFLNLLYKSYFTQIFCRMYVNVLSSSRAITYTSGAVCGSREHSSQGDASCMSLQRNPVQVVQRINEAKSDFKKIKQDLAAIQIQQREALDQVKLEFDHLLSSLSSLENKVLLQPEVSGDPILFSDLNFKLY